MYKLKYKYTREESADFDQPQSCVNEVSNVYYYSIVTKYVFDKIIYTHIVYLLNYVTSSYIGTDAEWLYIIFYIIKLF